MSGDGSKGNSFKKEGEQTARSNAVEENYSYRNNRSSRPNGLPSLPPTPTPASPPLDDGRHCAGGANPP